MDGELLFKSVMEPSVMLVPAADCPPGAGRNDVVRKETLDALELLLLLRILHVDGVRLWVGLPHR